MLDIQVLNDLPVGVLLIALFFGTFISEDAACLAAGAAAASGRIGLAAAIAACFLGIFAGDMLLYAVGRTLGNRIVDNRIVRRLVSKKAIDKASAWLDHNGASAVFLSRFVTGLRLPTYLVAGALRTDIKKFTLYFLFASIIWTPILVGSATYLQSTALISSNRVLGIVILFLFVRCILKYSSRKNRRLAVGRIKRIINWEFWPVQIFYIPVVIYVLWLGIRHKSLTLFTAANPAFPAGGFKGESKREIYQAIGASAHNRQYLLQYKCISACLDERARLRQALRFLDEHNLTFPLVIKPDAGERGKGVRILNSADELADAAFEMKTDFLLHEFVGGVEASIFYYRRPQEKRGHIFSITEKRFPAVAGDGKSTLEQLILDDPRAVCLANRYFEQLDDRLDQILPKNSVIRLIDIGTHSRGAVFCDGGWLRTPQIEVAVDNLCRRIDGFYFGRFDVRASSFEELQLGNFKIIELNGVTSESTNIYDPRYSLIDAYRVLFRQWQLAFEIGAANKGLGERTSSVFELAGLTFGRKPKRIEMNPTVTELV